VSSRRLGMLLHIHKKFQLPDQPTASSHAPARRTTGRVESEAEADTANEARTHGSWNHEQ
jgi:hypothetical protein